MRNLASRVERLEAASPGEDVWLRKAEESFWDAVAAREASFPDEAEHWTEVERVAKLTHVEHMAWMHRFRGEGDLAYVRGLYGYGVPTNAMGFIMAQAWIPGDETI